MQPLVDVQVLGVRKNDVGPGDPQWDALAAVGVLIRLSVCICASDRALRLDHAALPYHCAEST